MKRTSTFLPVVLLLGSAVGGLWAADEALPPGPTTKQPQLGLAVRAENQATLTMGIEAYQTALPLMQEFAKARQSNPASLKSEVTRIGHANTAIRKLMRAANRLKLAGEPAGFDLELRGTELSRELGAVRQAVKLQPGVLPALTKDLNKFLAQPAARDARKLPKLDKDFRAGKVEEAEQQFYQMLDALEEMGHWYEVQQREAPFAPFVQAERSIGAQMRTRRQEAAKAELARLRSESTPDFDTLLADIAAATGTLTAAPSAAVGGQNLSGPDCLAHFIDRWQQGHLGALRCRALDDARKPLDSTAAAQRAEIERQHTVFNDAILPALAKLVDADAQRAAGAQVDPLYLRYLEVLALVVAMCPGDRVGETFRPALSRLAAKNPNLAADVENYRAATSDLMRWRRRTATAFAAGAPKKGKPLRQAVVAAAGPKPPSPGLTEGNSLQQGLLLKGPIPVLLGGVQSLVDQQVSVQNILGGAQDGSGSSPYQQSVTATVPSLAPLLSGYIPILQYELLVADDLPPLTLEAATVMAAARRGDAVAAGGSVVDLTLTGRTNYFGSLKQISGSSIRLGRLPVEKISTTPGRNLVMTCQLEPAWVQFELFFIPIP